MQLPPAVYWRLRFLQAESEKAMAEAAARELRFRSALLEAGVPAHVEHRWQDHDTSVVPLHAAQETPCAPV